VGGTVGIGARRSLPGLGVAWLTGVTINAAGERVIL
jgi:hypothetical protein